METLPGLLAEHPFLAGLKPDHFPFLLEAASQVKYPAGQILFQEGGEADRFILVHRGQVALETFVPGRGQITIQTVGSGEALGWSWLFPPYRWHFSARVNEPTDAIVFDARRLRTTAAEHCGFGYDLVTRVAQVVLQRLQATRLQLLDFYDVHD